MAYDKRKHRIREARVGVDIGRVIINGDGPDTAFFGHDQAEALRTPAVPGAFDGVAELVRRFGAGRVYLVSKCGPKIQERSLAWLGHHGFWAATGVDPAHVRFCRERRDKAQHARQLGLTHFVDDRFDVLSHLVGLVDRMYLFGPQRRRSQQLPGMLLTPRWSDVLDDLAWLDAS
ncbi:MAG TPA: hypothetical protein VM869_14295 [Enhygromyxa sp.]|nr:hypothetical protein [Enhygromyxa sp.]